VSVLAAPVTQQDVPVYISALGSVTPTDSVTIRTQVNGQLLNLHFTEGQVVAKESLLAEIDPRPYEAQLLQYQGQLARDKALLANAQLDLERYKTLFAQDSIAKQTLDTQEALVKQYEGDVKTDKGQIYTARVNLTYCKITSPITGLVGIRQVDPGNFVQSTDANGIVVINTISPIYIIFTITEDDLPRVARKMADGAVLQALAQDRSQNKLLEIGTVLTTDNQINSSTGTIKVKAQFANEKNMLFPNQFVNIQLLIDTLKNAKVVPTAAVQHGVKGNFVYLLNKDQTVSIKPIKIIGSIDDNTAIESEIPVGQKVVIEGADKLKDGTTVNVLTNKQEA
jgi:multidrug efflux system membrane fusion protein